MADNAEFVRSLYEAWNRRDFDMIAQACTPETVITDVGSGATFRGPDGAIAYNTAWADGFPDGQITVDRLIDAGDTVVAEFTGRGTQTGPLVGPGGTIAPTGRSVTLHLCDVLEVGDGKLRSQRAYHDSGALLTQLGILEVRSTEATSQ